MIDFGFDKQYQDAAKKYEQLVEQFKQVNEFWVNSVISSLKSFVKTK